MPESEEEQPFQEEIQEAPLASGTVQEIELQRLREEAQEYKDKYWRALAELENVRKRLQKEKQDLAKFAAENVIVEFLAPLDQLEAALKFAENSSDEVRNWALGFQMILAQFKEVLASHGVEAFTSHGESFDPHLHEALEILHTDDHPHETVIHEYSKGYRMGQRTIRPAKVRVSKAVEPQEPTSQDQE